MRTVLVEQDMLALHAQASENSPVVARAELGVIARLGECSVDWCRISADGEKGWARKAGLWGVDAGEVRE